MAFKKLLRLDKTKYYEMHLSIVNCVLPVKLTPREIDVLSAFMALEGDIAMYRFGPSAKKIVMKNLGLKPTGLSNYIGDLLEKGFLLKQGDVITIWPVLIPDDKEQEYHFKLENIGNAVTNTGESN